MMIHACYPSMSTRVSNLDGVLVQFSEALNSLRLSTTPLTTPMPYQ